MTGYGKFAQLMADYPGLTIYRKFGALSFKVLLYMQAELVHLENELKIIAQDDPEKASFEVSWAALFGASSQSGADLQRQKIIEIQEKVNTYRMISMKIVEFIDLFTHQSLDRTLLQTSRVLGLSKPLASDLAFVREWLEMEDGGDFFLQDIEADPWEPEHSADLIVLAPTEHKDDFAKYLFDKVARWYHHYLRRPRNRASGSERWSGFAEYSDDLCVTVGNVICMALSSVIPTASIFVLYFVETMVARLAVITAMSFLFSLVMTVIVRGRRVDVFAATTAFAAVQVVFVGGVNIF